MEPEYPEAVEDVEFEHQEEAGAIPLAATIEPEQEDRPRLSILSWSRSIGNLIGALCQAALEFGEVKKESENPFFKSSYADLATMIGATRPQLAKYGVFVIQAPGINVAGKVVIATLIAHKSNEWILCVLDDLPVSKQDIQGYGSGFTYGRRYSYAPATNIAGEEDDDGNRAMGSRKEHLAKLDDQMRGQERITLVQAKAFDDAVSKTKTKEQVEKYLDQLNGYRASTEIQKRQYNDAIKWAVTRTEQPAGEEKTPLQQDVEKSLDFVKLNRELRAAMTQHGISNTPVHHYIKGKYNADSLKDLSEQELRALIHWVDSEEFKKQ